MGRDPPLVARADRPAVADKDKAQYFDGSQGETVTHRGTGVSLESLGLSESATSFSMASTSSENGSAGLKVTTETDGVLEVTVSSLNASVSRVALYRASDGSQLEVLAATAGDTVTFGAELTAFESYYVEADNDGSSWTAATRSEGFPIDAGALSIERAQRNQGETTNTDNVLVFSDLTLDSLSGSAYVEWQMPADLYAWDLGKYLATEDGGTVTVAVEEADGAGGWSEVVPDLNNPGDLSGLDPERNIRFRVDISRPSTAENPRLEALYRRFKL